MTASAAAMVITFTPPFAMVVGGYAHAVRKA